MSVNTTITCQSKMSSQNVSWWPTLPKAGVSSLLLFVYIVLYGLLSTFNSFVVWKPLLISISLAVSLRDKHEVSHTRLFSVMLRILLAGKKV